MKKPEISFRPYGGSGPLSIYWSEGPYGDAIEAIKGNGVSWHSASGELLGVEFDDVSEKEDTQTLKLFNNIKINLKIINGKISFEVLPAQKKIA